jgi:acid phosphatase family membrane protein YuiD
MGMRRQVGEHAKVINKLFKNLSESLNDPELAEKALEELAGHTPLQVFAGMLLGILLPIAMMAIPAFELGMYAPEAAEACALAGNILSAI